MKIRMTATATIANRTKNPTIWSAKRILNFIRASILSSARDEMSILVTVAFRVEKLEEVRIVGGDLSEHL